MASTSSTPAPLDFAAPFFIVRDVVPSIAFYRDLLGFEVTFAGPDDDPYFAMLKRDGVWVMLKSITPEVEPMPNSSRHQWARWDAYIHTSDPDALAEEFASRGVSFREPLGINSDGLRGFEVVDADGYVLFFGSPVQAPRRGDAHRHQP
jgi:catechol 2,3-dioxygenase-like lactoylglutathione lyase family enzyme